MKRQLTMKAFLMALSSVVSLALIVTKLAICDPAFAQDPITPLTNNDALLFGMSTPLSGREADIGTELVAGVSTAFRSSSGNTKLHGKKLELLALDDSYNPRTTAKNLRQLIDDFGVLAVIASTGGHALQVSTPISKEEKVLLLAPFGNQYGKSSQITTSRYVVYFRPSISEEVSALANWLVTIQGIAPSEIAMVSERDSYGDASFTALLTALSAKGLKSNESIAHFRFERSSIAVEGAIADLLLAKQKPKAVVVIGSYPSVAQFIKIAKKSNLDALIATTSTVGPEALAKNTLNDGTGVVVTQVVPSVDSELPLVKSYRKDLAYYLPQRKPSSISLEGYLVGTLVIRTLESMGQEVTPEGLIDALDRLGEFDLGLAGSASISPYQHQLSNTVYASVITGGTLRYFEWFEKLPVIESIPLTADTPPAATTERSANP